MQPTQGTGQLWTVLGTTLVLKAVGGVWEFKSLGCRCTVPQFPHPSNLALDPDGLCDCWLTADTFSGSALLNHGGVSSSPLCPALHSLPPQGKVRAVVFMSLGTRQAPGL